jgi:hypothetical protein
MLSFSQDENTWTIKLLISGSKVRALVRPLETNEIKEKTTVRGFINLLALDFADPMRTHWGKVACRYRLPQPVVDRESILPSASRGWYSQGLSVPLISMRACTFKERNRMGVASIRCAPNPRLWSTSSGLGFPEIVAITFGISPHFPPLPRTRAGSPSDAAITLDN